MRGACIDIGSNTTRLLVADCDASGLTEVHQERAFTRLGHGLRAGGVIPSEKISDVVAVVLRLSAVANELGAADLRVVATAAVRTAANGEELVSAVARTGGPEVTIVSAEEEARLAFVGAAAMMGTDAPRVLGVVDVGGGSTEIVVGRAPGDITWWSSISVGSGALTEHRFAGDPPSPDELSAARAEVEQALAGHEPPRPTVAVAVGGSATSLSRLAGPVLDAATLQRSLALLTNEPAAAVADRFGIDPQRARLLPAGLMILEGSARLLDATLMIGRGGIREGVLLEALAS